MEGVNYEVPEGAGEPRGSIHGRRDSERGSNRATGEGYREGLRLGGDLTRAEGEGERVSERVPDYLYYVWRGNTANVMILSGEQGYLCLKRFLEEEGQK